MGELAVSVPSGNRQKLLDKRIDLTNKLAAIDEAIGLLDKNPELERLADLLPFVLRSEY